MSRRKAAAPLLPAIPAPAGEITAAFEREKHRFLTRHAQQCPYLLVQLLPDLPNRRLTLVASYAFSSAREWQQVDTQIAIAALHAKAGPEPGFAEAFACLDEGIGAARIARLFAPRTAAQRMAAGRS
ncbi:MAG: hypothetical protein EON57_02755 [Alphaproteobacteria bacterium]|nr:MAG: hypothetical protein EON57_02755 [Alphaproteobacteria bacterium]